MLYYGLKHSLAPKRIPTESTVTSVEGFWLVSETYQNLSRITSEAELLPRYNKPLYLTITWAKDEQQALKQLKSDKNIGCITVVMDRTIALTKWTYLLTTNKLTKNLNATRRKHLNETQQQSTFAYKKTDAIKTQRYYQLRCSVPQPPKLYGLPKLHKPGIPVRPKVSFC